MKKLLPTLLFINSFLFAFGQDIPLLGNYYYLPLTQNPSLTSFDDQTRIFGVHKTRMANLENHPTLYGFILETPFARKKSGFGTTVYRETQGISNVIGANLMSSYRFKVNRFQQLSLGLSFGAIFKQIDYSNVVVKDYDDPYILDQVNGDPKLNATFGLTFTSRKVQIGFAVPQLLAQPQNGELNPDLRSINTLSRHYQISFGYDFVLDILKQISFKPMVLAKSSDFSNAQFDVHGVLMLKDVFWLGALWRQDYGTSLNIGMLLKRRLTLGYSYDMIASDIYREIDLGLSHEIMLGYTFAHGEKKEKPIIEKEEELFEVSEPEEIEKIEEKPLNEEVEVEEEMMMSRRVFRTRPLEDFEQSNGSPAKRGYYLVVGSFSITPFAQRAVTVRKATGYPDADYLYSKTSKLHYVYVKGFPTLDEAEQILIQLQNGEFPDCFILGLENPTK